MQSAVRSIVASACATLALTTPIAAAGDSATPARPLHVERWLGPDNYPPAAIRAGEQGRVVATVSIDAQGMPTECHIDQPAGLPELERGTCETIMAKGRFDPSRNRKGKPVASTMKLPVRWVIPAFSNTLDTFDLLVTATLDKERITRCDVTINGRAHSQPAGFCNGQRPSFESVRDNIGSPDHLRVGFEVAKRHGDTPPAVPASAVTGKVLTLVEERETVSADGSTSGCSTAITGALADRFRPRSTSNDCDKGTRFEPVTGSDGKPKPQQALIVTRYTVISPLK